ncbi:MAG: FG-GAP-like repeat-containing protein [Pyrinomonadaceae bacterium]
MYLLKIRPPSLTLQALFIAFCLASVCATVSAQKVRLRSQITPDCTVASGNSGLKFADIFAEGNVAVQGTYNCRGVFIYDLTDPDNPVLASTYDPAPHQAFLEAIVVGKRGYFGSGGPFPSGSPNTGDGVHIVDLADPYHPGLLGKVKFGSGNGFNGIHEMVVTGNYLIENYNSLSNSALKFIDIRDPANPIYRWEISPGDGAWVHAVHIRGDRMYTSGWGGTIEIYDISNLDTQQPALIGSISGDYNNHSAWTSEDGKYLYSCRETLDGDLRVYDVSDPAQPFLVLSLKTSNLGLNAISPHNPVVMGNYLYVSWYQAGIQVFELSDLIPLKHVAQYDTYQPAFAPPATELRTLADAEPWDLVCGASNLQNSLPTSYQGNWAVFPFLGQDKILAGDMEHGLLVLDASKIASPLENQISDFDGDGRTDISTFTPGSGNWSIIKSSDQTQLDPNFGLTGDVLTSGDYNGDGITELSVFRPSTGVWWFRSPSGQFTASQFGLTGDIPMPADYDADGKTDIAVFRPSNGSWYILQSSLGLRIVNWGLASDIPITGDFEGDGKPDIAVWRPSSGVWYVLQSSSSVPMYATWGIAGDKPLSADFDGNGRADFVVFRPSTGIWYIFDPEALPSYRGIAWGIAEDIPIPADYDGDSKADAAVFRPSTNQWYRVNSANGTYDIRTFGQPGDVPSPASAQPQ